MKQSLKQILTIIMRWICSPFYLIFILTSLIFGKRKAFSDLMQGVSLIPGMTGEWIRKAVLQWVSGDDLKDCCICFGCLFSDHRVSIGRGVYIGPRCDIGWAEIGKDCVIGSSVHILSGLRQHSFDKIDVPIRDQENRFDKVTIGKDSWIGNGAVIAADIGKGCIIGAGSIVIKSLPDYAIAVGNPAQCIASRKNKTQGCL